MKIVIITGLSGAGKTKAVGCMEDLGYYCIDNLPPKLMDNFLALGTKDIEKAALVMDIRGGEFFNDLKENIEKIKKIDNQYKVIFLEASDEILIRRFKESRRIHPISKEGSLIEGIKQERKKLAKIHEIADYIIDTSNLTISQLKHEMEKIFETGKKVESLTVNIMSFGYKKGIPLDSDLVFDVRFIPNPFYLSSMKHLTGNSRKVREYVMKWPESKAFVEKIDDLIEYLIPFYVKEGKPQLVIAFGCTGGQHRSVVLANEFLDKLSNKGRRVSITHRDL